VLTHYPKRLLSHFRGIPTRLPGKGIRDGQRTFAFQTLMFSDGFSAASALPGGSGVIEDRVRVAPAGMKGGKRAARLPRIPRKADGRLEVRANRSSVSAAEKCGT